MWWRRSASRSPESWGVHRHGPQVAAPVRGRPLAGLADAPRTGRPRVFTATGRWLARDALKPWQHRSWISVRDPQFAVRAARVLDLYAGTWDGRPPGENELRDLRR